MNAYCFPSLGSKPVIHQLGLEMGLQSLSQT